MAIARKQLTTRAVIDVTELIAFYRSAAQDIQTRVAARLVRDPATPTVEAGRARVLLAEVEDIIARLEAQVTEWLYANLPKDYIQGMRRAEAGLKEIGAAATAATINPRIHRQAVEVLVNSALEQLQDIPRTITNDIRRIVLRTSLTASQDAAIKKAVAKGIVAGKTRREVSKEIRARLAETALNGEILIGRRWKIADYAEMVARTMHAEAVTAGTVNRLIEEGHDLVMVDEHGATDACGFYEGKVFSISGTDNRYPALSELPNGGPPFHPRCTHVLIPYVEALASEREKERAAGVPKKALGKPFAQVEKERRRAA